MTRFDTELIDEPKLLFAGGQEMKDPRAGLMKYGPWNPSGDTGFNEIKVGFIGSSQSIYTAKRLFTEMETVIPRRNPEPRRHKPPFPSMGADSPFRASLNMQRKWQWEIEPGDSELITQARTTDKSVATLLDLMEKYMKNLSIQDPPPKVVVISLPEEIVEACTPENVKHAKLKAGETDFHDRIKTFGLEFDLPTQLIRPSTLRFDGSGQEKAEVAWNLAVGMLYKSREGRPWKLAHLENNTCYAGISFYRERHGDQSKTHASLAQVFLSTGESFVLRGDPAVTDEQSGNHHLTQESANGIATQIFDQYETFRKTLPSRFVLYKTSRFKSEEREGFLQAADDIPELDFVTVRGGDPLRLYSQGDYPPLRGTVASPRGTDKYFLYTQGYIPTLETYPGPRIPAPITVEPDPEVTHSSYQRLCREILSFTKLDWNTSDFCKKKPVTIRVARAVGAILAEAEQRGIRVKPQYYYYM